MSDHDDAVAVITLRAELFPSCFFVYEGHRRPLKIGIRDDIAAQVDGAIGPHATYLFKHALVQDAAYGTLFASHDGRCMPVLRKLHKATSMRFRITSQSSWRGTPLSD